jgi:hypothetical protein
MLRNVFGPQTEEITREWRKFHIEKPNDFVPLNKYLDEKIEDKKCAGLVAHMGQTALHTRFVWRSLKASHHLEGLDVGGRIILNIYLKRERIC